MPKELDPALYQQLENLDAAGLAWECLRRNPDYRAAYARIAAGETVDVQSWGLRFRG
jgi:outer membrane protein TolC